MLTDITRSARISKCGLYRWTLARAWDGRPMLLVVMFNPSTASHTEDDPTITLLCQLAAHNGFGGIVVVNGIPLRSSTPAPAVDMVNTWDKRCDWSDRDLLHENVAVIQKEVARAGAILLAWGNLASRCDSWFDHVLEQIEEVRPAHAPVFCLGKTALGYPKHPLARGKHKVRKDEQLQLWSTR
ncbi:DUF1643 domain-containing protein [Hydrogenophaga defluvii]|uniref:DUF1643 domain-containing protein n=1 Tax=Hydrogenophaga defluvii TaxID=249410 RepID=A0ABW2SC70_9BURK